MKKSNWIILITLLIGVVVIFVLKDQKKTTTLKVEADFFQIKDTATIDKLFITDIDGNQLTLTRKEGVWRLNDQYRVDKKAYLNLIEPLVKMRIKAPADDASKEALIREMTVGHKKVEVYRNGEMERVLYIGNATKDGLGTYIYSNDEGLDRPYIVHIPGWNGNLGPRFFLNKTALRSKKLFHLSPSNIQKLEVNYTNDSLPSYGIRNIGNGQVEVYPLNEGVAPIKNLDDRKAKEVLINSNKIFFEDFITNASQSLKDSVYNTLPEFARISIDVEGRETETAVLKIAPQNGLSPELTGDIPIDRFYVYFPDKKPLFIARLQQQMAVKLLKRFDRFEKSN